MSFTRTSRKFWSCASKSTKEAVPARLGFERVRQKGSHVFCFFTLLGIGRAAPPASRGEFSGDLYVQPADDPRGARLSPDGIIYICRHAGTELVDGIPTEKWEFGEMRPDRFGRWNTIWIEPASRVVLRQFVWGTICEIRNVRFVVQPAEWFALPQGVRLRETAEPAGGGPSPPPRRKKTMRTA